AVTESEVVMMTQNRVGDDVIINSIRTRGCRWNSAPENVIALKQQGVSDRVITVMQNTGMHAPVATVVPGPPPVVYAPPPPPVGGVVVVGPAYGPRPYYYGRPYYYRRW